MFLNKKDKLQELKDFLDQDTSKEAQEYLTKPSEYWQKEGEKMALNLFHRAAEDVPAYKDYLKKHKIDHKEIKTYEDFKKVPVTTKNDYLKAYPLDKLTWNGNMNDLYMLSSSSGSTGHPFFWPRGETEEIEGALTHEKIFTSFFGVTRNTPTLVVVGFSMGTWIAGPYTLASINYLAKKGYPITTITPGIEKEVFLKLLRDVSPYFKKIILAGYPPFIKDVVDLGPEYGINWKDLNINFLFAGEGFSEKWREHVLKK